MKRFIACLFGAAFAAFSADYAALMAPGEPPAPPRWSAARDNESVSRPAAARPRVPERDAA